MRIPRIVVVVCITLGLTQTGCGEDRTIKDVPTKVTDTGKAPVAPSAPPGKQKDLTCPTGWEEFCGGWTVSESTTESGGNEADHIDIGDRIVIGEKGSNMWVFPRDTNLQDRWDGEKKIKLEKISAGGPCLTGKVKLKHDGAVEWHRITFTTEVKSATGNSEIGDEYRLKIGFVSEAQSTVTPTSCPTVIAQGEGGLEPDHGGLAHAED